MVQNYGLIAVSLEEKTKLEYSLQRSMTRRCQGDHQQFHQQTNALWAISCRSESRTFPKIGFRSLLSPSTYLPAFSQMPIREWEIWPIGSHQPIYRHIFTHYPINWLWVPFEPINLSTGIFTDAHSGMGNLTLQVPLTYLLANFHTLSQKMALSSFRAHQPIYRHFYGCPFWNGKLDQLGPINLSTGIFSCTIP